MLLLLSLSAVFCIPTLLLLLSPPHCPLLTVPNHKAIVFPNLFCRYIADIMPCMPCMHAKLLQLCWTLFDPTDHDPQGPLFMGILQARYWSGLPCFPPRDLPGPGIAPPSHISCFGRRVLYQLSYQGKEESEVAQLCPTLCNPMDCSLPGSSVHGIFQARVLEWGAISFSRRSSRPRG